MSSQLKVDEMGRNYRRITDTGRERGPTIILNEDKETLHI